MNTMVVHVLVELQCHACMATMRTVLEASPAAEPNSMQLNLTTGIGAIWQNSHHMPRYQPLAVSR